MPEWSEAVWSVVVWGCGLACAVLYFRAWRTGSSILPSTKSRLLAFVISMIVAAVAIGWPLDALSRSSVLARMGQTVTLCLIAAPLFWLALPFHKMAWALPPSGRRAVARWTVRPHSFTPALRMVAAPLVAWFLYLCAVLTWHEPGFVDVTMARPALHRLAAVLLFAAALNFWQVVTQCGPRLNTRADLAARLAMIVAIEIANVAAGISIAFRSDPIYGWYANQGDLSMVVAQQSLAGALTWVFGSVVYIVSAVLIVNQVFRKHGVDAPHRMPGWDSDDRFIAPGLEGRLTEPSRVPHDWTK